MRIAVFGGSFDPPHFGHFGIARAVLQHELADLVLFVPAWKAPHKLDSRSQTPYFQRLEMLKLLLDGIDEASCRISQVEGTEKKEPSYTIDTMRSLSAQYPGDDLSLLIGSDSLLDLHSWHRGGELVARYNFITYPRPGVEVAVGELKKHWPEAVAEKLFSSLACKLDVFDFSSSDLRRNLRSDIAKCALMTSEKILDYIKQNKLYTEE